MSLYCVNISGREYRIFLNGDKGIVNGEAVQLNLLPLNGNGLHMLRQGAKALELYLSNHDPETYELFVEGKRVIAKVETLQKRLRRKSETVSAGTIKAPMPGLVVNIPVKAGDRVEAGQTVIVLESMKMQMQIRSQVSGKINKIAVQNGQQVEKGLLMVQIDPEE